MGGEGGGGCTLVAVIECGVGMGGGWAGVYALHPQHLNSRLSRKVWDRTRKLFPGPVHRRDLNLGPPAPAASGQAQGEGWQGVGGAQPGADGQAGRQASQVRGGGELLGSAASRPGGWGSAWQYLPTALAQHHLPPAQPPLYTHTHMCSSRSPVDHHHYLPPHTTHTYTPPLLHKHTHTPGPASAVEHLNPHSHPQPPPRSTPRRRTENLNTRTATKIENKKAKREKKLLRAGFEGRKSGFIGGEGKGGDKS